MAIVITRDNMTEWIKSTKAALAKLAAAKITVGILGSTEGTLLKIARVHEYGATITPTHARNLAIPLKSSVRGKSPREIANTWVLETGGKRFIVRDKGTGEIDFLFLLLPKVTIPERSFIRAGYDASKDLIAAACKHAAEQVIFNGLSPEDAAKHIGVACVGMIKRYMRTAGYAPKSSITLASAPGKTTPLIQSGALSNAIAYEVTI